MLAMPKKAPKKNNASKRVIKLGAIMGRGSAKQ